MKEEAMDPIEEKKQAKRSEAKQLLDDYLGMLQRQFYPDDKDRFYKHRYMLVQAITWTAREMKRMGVWLPFARQREILNEIIKGVKHHGDTEKVKHFGAYFLHSVQAHIKHRIDHLYDEGKTAAARGIAGMPLKEILKGAGATEETEAQACDRLVEIADTFKPRRKPKTVAKQMDFFS